MNALLFGDPSPSLRWRAAVELDGVSENDAEGRAWRAEIDSSEELRALVAQLGAARDNPQAAGYLLCRLTYLGYRGPELAAAVDGIFAHQQPDGRHAAQVWPARFSHTFGVLGTPTAGHGPADLYDVAGIGGQTSWP